MLPPPPRLLHHLHLGRTTFTTAQQIQSSLASRFLVSKSPDAIEAPPPTILTSEFFPVYTLGRRDLHTPVTESQRRHLEADGRAELHPTLRGGQTTFHGPGQLTAYVVLDLKSFTLSPRCYIALLEDAVIDVAAHFGITGFKNDVNPGVWTSSTRKLCAVGVHMRRNVTGFGIGLNVNTDLWWFDRIVACGLEGYETTSFLREGVRGRTVEEVGGGFVEMMRRRLGVGETVRVEGREMMGQGRCE